MMGAGKIDMEPKTTKHSTLWIAHIILVVYGISQCQTQNYSCAYVYVQPEQLLHI